MAAAASFPVRRKEPELVVPAKPTPTEVNQLSDIDDQQGFRFHFLMMMSYRSNPLMEGYDPVSVIKDAVSRALVYYYPYAGRLIQGPNTKLMVNCNGEGVLFVEADAEVRLEELRDSIQPPCPYSKQLLYDVPGSSVIVGGTLMLIQFTRLICGGFIFAIGLNHVMSDATGLIQFLNAVAEMARGASIPSVLPVWKRELLCARNMPTITFTHYEYDDGSKRNLKVAMDNDNQVCKSFFFGPREIVSIRKHLPPNATSSSVFDLITATVWRCHTVATIVNPDEVVRLACAVNLRRDKTLNLPPEYYGNTIVTPAVVSKAEELCNKPLVCAVELVRQAKGKGNGEYARSVADFMVMNGRPPITANLKVSDSSKAGFDEVDFGWGKPSYGGTMDGGTFTKNNTCIYARFRNDKGENGILVPLCFPSVVMLRFEEELRKLMTKEPMEDLNNLNPTKITSML